MTPTQKAKHWALETLINEMRHDHSYGGGDATKAENRARARFIANMVGKLEKEKVILDGTVLPGAVLQWLPEYNS
jgi:hypothetical protein